MDTTPKQSTELMADLLDICARLIREGYPPITALAEAHARLELMKELQQEEEA